MMRRFLLLIKGFLNILSLQKKYKEYEKLIVVLHPGLGDICVACAHIKKFVENTNYIVICNSRYCDVVKQFGVDNVIGIPGSSCQEMAETYSSDIFRYLVSKKLRTNTVLVDPIHYITAQSLVFREITALSVTKKAIYRLPDNTETAYPEININGSIANTNNQKYVIINPYSNSMYCDISFFEKVAEYCINIGYTVYCNLAPGQIPIRNSTPLQCSIEELYSWLLKAEFIVSMRSGILDYLIKGIKKAFVIYDDEKFYNFCTLSAWETKEMIEEVIYDKNTTITQVFEWIDNVVHEREEND